MKPWAWIITIAIILWLIYFLFIRKMNATKAIKNYIKSKEGLRLQPYKDDAASTPQIEYSIGYGHQIQPSEEWMMNGITKEQADQFFDKDIQKFETAINKLVIVPLTQNQFDSLVSFVYNIGEGNFTKSNLLRQINQKIFDSSVIRQAFNSWVNAAGSTSNILIQRRNEEANWFLA